MRIWLGRSDEEARAELEPAIPRLSYDPDDYFFRRFFMRRLAELDIPEEEVNRPLPAGWERKSVEPEWDMKAGKKENGCSHR